MAKKRQRIPKLKFTAWRDVGWHVSYRNPSTRSPRKHSFGIVERSSEAGASLLYHAWVLQHIGGDTTNATTSQRNPTRRRKSTSNVLSGSILEIASGLIETVRARVRKDGDPRRRGSLAPPVFRDSQKQIRDFLEFLNERYGDGAVAKLRLQDISMEYIEDLSWLRSVA